MGVDLYDLDRQRRRTLLVGDTRHEVGVLRRLWKSTATNMRQGREETLETLADEQAVRAVRTPRAVIVDTVTDFEIDGRSVPGRRLLGWDAGRLVTQDLDWDHLPTLGWAVDDQDGDAVLHEERDGRLVDVARAHELGIVTSDTEELAEHRTPTIAECRSVRRLSASHFQADCRLEDGREVVVLGESETGELPDVGWFAARTTSSAARYGVVDQLASRG